jgi:hypothetical protein
MRLLVLVLVLANVGFFAWSRYYPANETQHSPLAQQIEPEKLRIVPPLKPAASAPVPPGACLEWGSFTLADYPRAQKALEPLGLDAPVAQRRTEEVAGWWVFVPPQGSRPAALRMAAELKTLGVQDYFILTEEGEYRWALSLGVYRSEEAAQARLNALSAMGVGSALMAPRATSVPKVWLQIKVVDPALEARLRDIVRQIEGSELRTCS